MTQPSIRSAQRGVVLVVGLLLLLVMTIVAVASLSSTHMQERMAGNARTQALAFQLASTGAASSLEFYAAQELAGGLPDTDCGTRDHPGWVDADGDPVLTAWVTAPNDDLIQGTRLRQRIYCLQVEYPDGQRELKSHPFVLSRGEVVSSDNTVVAQRDIEVRLDFGATPPGDPDCTALCFPYCASGDSLRFPTSNAFKVDGEGSPAITTGTLECADAITGAIRSNRIGNYDGGIAGTDTDADDTLGYPWGSPTDVNNFRNALLAFANGTATIPSGYSAELIPGDLTASGNRVFGTTSEPQITYIAGDADMAGNVSGTGILVVEGDLQWNGTPEFQGLILVLGGGFEVYGGGQGGDPAGSLTVLNLFGADGETPRNDEAGFGSIDLDFRGGGTALYRYDCLLLQGLATGLGLGDENGGWYPSCDSAGSGVSTPGTRRIASWRENLGWRTFIDAN